MRFGDLATIKLAWLRFNSFGDVVDKDLAVNLGRVHGSPAFQQTDRFPVMALPAATQFPAYQRLFLFLLMRR